MTRSEENYIKTIFHLGKKGTKEVATNSIAELMETKPSSVTDMIKKLSEKDLVNYRPYQGVSLTATGNKMALGIIRKHRLWEVFLVEKLDFSWDEVHDIAEQLEHIKSDKLVDSLDRLLGFPEFDPHGDPIPDRDGKYKERDRLLLSDVPIRTTGICVGVRDSSATFLKFLDKNKIALGNRLQVLEIEEFDGSLLIDVHGTKMQISHQIASNLYIKIEE